MSNPGRTPVSGISGAVEENSEEKQLMRNPVEMNLPEYSASKTRKASLMKHWFDWKGSYEYSRNQELKMHRDMKTEPEWRLWFRAFINYLKLQICCFEFFDMGFYQQPMEWAEDRKVNVSNSTMRSLNSTFDQMAALATNVGSDTETKKTKKTTKI